MTELNYQYFYSWAEIEAKHSYFYFKHQEIQVITRKKCPECLNPKIYYDDIRDELYCSHCGLVLESSAPYSGSVKILYPFNYNFVLKKNYRRTNYYEF
jgi:ribosomal protein S27E